MSCFLFYCLHVDHYFNKNDGTGFVTGKKSGSLPVLFSSPPCSFCFYSKPHLWHWESRIQCVNSLTLLMMSSLECLIGWNSLTVRPHPTQSRPMCISAHTTQVRKWKSVMFRATLDLAEAAAAAAADPAGTEHAKSEGCSVSTTTQIQTIQAHWYLHFAL